MTIVILYIYVCIDFNYTKNISINIDNPSIMRDVKEIECGLIMKSVSLYAVMFDRIINILLIESEIEASKALGDILQQPGHNVFIAENEQTAIRLVNQKRFVLIFLNLDLPFVNEGFIRQITSGLSDSNIAGNTTIIVSSENKSKAYKTVSKNAGLTTFDYFMRPFDPDLVHVKTEIYKRLYFKHQRVSQLLETILPSQTLREFQRSGKSSPKKKSNCAIMFTDFVDFSVKTRNKDPQEIVKTLDRYFTQFDRIILKYKLEKIKTIGDAYMVVGGVTEDDPHPAVRMALAAIEIRNYVETKILTQKAFQKDYWEVRIGLHLGDLVAGVVGQHKFSFDVWGHDVNIAARCEQHSKPNKISVTEAFAEVIAPYFDTTYRGKIQLKNQGETDLMFLNKIKEEHSLYGEGRTPNVALRKSLKLPTADFLGIRSYILTRLKAELDDKLIYHSHKHTEKVEEAVIKYAELEQINAHDLILVRTAALFHDAGFLFRYHDNEELAVELFKEVASDFGYTQEEIDIIESIIMRTVYGNRPQNLLESIMCDADLDYLGRIDYHVTAKLLFDEMALFGLELSEKERVKKQIHYLEDVHEYYTVSAKNIRGPGKAKRLAELKEKLQQLKNPTAK